MYEMHRGGSVLLVLSSPSSVPSNQAPRDNVRDFSATLIVLLLREAYYQCINIKVTSVPW